MALIIQRPARIDVTRENPTDVLYATGDADTDGSIRFIVADICQVEKRVNGVFNTTKLRTGGKSIEIGRDMSVSALAGFIETINPSQAVGHARSLVPHIEFNAATGTTESQLHTPTADLFDTFVVFSSAVSEVSGTVLGQILGVSPGRSMKTSVHEVGTVGASEDVTVNIFTGSDNTGVLVSSVNFPASDLIANTSFIIDYDEVFGFDEGVLYFQEFVSAAAFTLKINEDDNILTTHNGNQMGVLNVVTENLYYDKDLNPLLDLSENPYYSRQF